MNSLDTYTTDTNTNTTADIETIISTIFPLKTNLVGRQELEYATSLAILTKQHILLVGKPGTAKSLFADRIFGYFDAKVFKTQLSKFSTEETLFGPLNINALKKGRYEYIYDGTILDSEFSFIDEIFDASDSLLRTLLGVLNERQFRRGAFKVRTPLWTAIATANYTRYNEITEAVIDRFLFQMPVEKVFQFLFGFRHNTTGIQPA